MSRLEEFDEITCKAVTKLFEEKVVSVEERDAKVVSMYLCDIARSLAMIADALNGEKED